MLPVVQLLVVLLYRDITGLNYRSTLPVYWNDRLIGDSIERNALEKYAAYDSQYSKLSK
jgi:hypothetical protein